MRELIGDWVHEVNDGLADEEDIRSFALLPNELGREDGVLTSTCKVRREAIADRFAELVEGMFS